MHIKYVVPFLNSCRQTGHLEFRGFLQFLQEIWGSSRKLGKRRSFPVRYSVILSFHPTKSEQLTVMSNQEEANECWQINR